MSSEFAIDQVEAQAQRSEQDAATERIRSVVDNHPLWNSRLFIALCDGVLDHADLRWVFAQYAHYSRTFSRLVAGLVAACDDELWRARIIANLWEEAGASAEARRHTLLYENFLRHGLGLAPGYNPIGASAELFVLRCLEFARREAPLRIAAFLGFGTETIVPRLYAVMHDALGDAGVPEGHLEFFTMHMACDDDHADVLNDYVTSYGAPSVWEEPATDAARTALDYRLDFFDGIYDEIIASRTNALFASINHRRSGQERGVMAATCDVTARDGTPLYRNRDGDIDFTVTRAPFPSETLDVRYLEIAPGHHNEEHCHAHESVLHVVTGEGTTLVDGREFTLRPGHAVYVPRWSRHYTINTGEVPLVIFAVTDYRFTRQVLIGDDLASTRRRPADASR